MADSDSYVCKPAEQRWYWWKARCGRDRDCLPDDRQTNFSLGYCGAIAYVRKSPGAGRYVECWDPDNTRRLFTITERNATYAKSAKCQESVDKGAVASFQFGDDSSPYTVDVPGLSDILRVPGIDDKNTRRERAQRMASHKSGLPDVLSWVPPLLNKLDNAQDLIYTATVIGLQVAKWLGFRTIPGLGLILTANDLLNGAT